MTYLPHCITAVGWDYFGLIVRCEVLEKRCTMHGDASSIGRSGADEPSAFGLGLIFNKQDDA